MIRQLRQRHLFMTLALGVLVPVGFVAGLMARNAVPVQTAPIVIPSSDRKILFEQVELWTESIRTKITADVHDADKLEVTLSPQNPLLKADVLVYWAAGKVETVHALPEHAILLGALVPEMPLPLPQMKLSETGNLVLYSLADHEVVAVSKNFKPRR